MFPEFAARSDVARTFHPGTVTFVGSDGLQRVEPAEHIPDWIKFAPGPNGVAIPVVRVVRLQTDRGFSLRSYCADGRLLWVGLMVPPTPPLECGRIEQPTVTTPAPESRPNPMDCRAPWDRAPFTSEPTGWF